MCPGFILFLYMWKCMYEVFVQVIPVYQNLRLETFFSTLGSVWHHRDDIPIYGCLRCSTQVLFKPLFSFVLGVNTEWKKVNGWYQTKDEMSDWSVMKCKVNKDVFELWIMQISVIKSQNKKYESGDEHNSLFCRSSQRFLDSFLSCPIVSTAVLLVSTSCFILLIAFSCASTVL